MSVRNLKAIFDPRGIAVVGASSTQGKVGNTVLRNLIESGYRGEIYSVNPKGKVIEGLQTFERLAELPASVELAIVCTPAETVPNIVRECGEAGIRGVIVLSAGFREMNVQGGLLERAIMDEARKFSGLRIIGPNCLGVMSPAANLNASFANGMPRKGRVAFISQSGALCTAVLDWARQEKIGFSHFVSVGNMLDVGFGDLIDYFEQDASTDAIIIYVESINKAREFLSAARTFSRSKPIIACKSGRFAESAHAAASHTGAMAGVDAVYDAAFARAGIIRVFDIEEMFDCVELLAKHSSVSGSRLAIVTNAGGPGVMATDALLGLNGRLAAISAKTMDQLNQHLPAAWSHGNPIDILGDATPERLKTTLQIVQTDEDIDAALVVLSPQAMTNPLECASAVVASAASCHKPILTSWMGGDSMKAGIELFNYAAIPTYQTPERAVRAFMHLVEYRRQRERLHETPHTIPLTAESHREQIDKLLQTAANENRSILKESEAKEILQAYGIPVTQLMVAKNATEAVECACRLTFPVAMKVVSPDITHKTDVGGVELKLSNEEAVASAFNRIQQRVQTHRPDARFEGVSIQPMVSDAGSRELIVGAMRDPVFGAVMLVGAGGVDSELICDRALGLPPLNELAARRMLESLRIWPLMQAHRGRPRINIEQVVDVLVRLSNLVCDNPMVLEIDINPLLVTPERSIALDARMILDLQPLRPSSRSYSHLAIRPYPSEYMKSVKLNDETTLLLRPITPEDRSMCTELISNCSETTLRSRFGCQAEISPAEIASRLCFADYDRELAIVAEITNEKGIRRIIGIGQLSADADHQHAEYFHFVGELWETQGVGSILSDYCAAISKDWGVQNLTQQVHRTESPENPRLRKTR